MRVPSPEGVSAGKDESDIYLLRKGAGAMRKFTAGLVLLLVGMVVSPAPAAYIETFDSSNAGWYYGTINNAGDVTTGVAAWQQTGGNGYIVQGASEATNRLYGYQAKNAAIFGELSGMILTVDLQLTGSIAQYEGADPMVRFYIGSLIDETSNYFVSNDLVSWNPNRFTGWQSHKVTLSEENFLRWPNADTGDKTFAQVIATVTDIGLIFTHSSTTFNNFASLGFYGDGAAVAIDNFGTVVPLPTAILLLGAGLVRLALYKRRQ